MAAAVAAHPVMAGETAEPWMILAMGMDASGETAGMDPASPGGQKVTPKADASAKPEVKAIEPVPSDIAKPKPLSGYSASGETAGMDPVSPGGQKAVPK
jgi:hypothetical protein